jgi:hypothetical protein
MVWRDVPCPISASHPIGREVVFLFNVWQALLFFLGGDSYLLGQEGGYNYELGIIYLYVYEMSA